MKHVEVEYQSPKIKMSGTTNHFSEHLKPGASEFDVCYQKVAVIMSLNLNQMTKEEKLGTMELLWDDICRNVPDLASPPGMETY